MAVDAVLFDWGGTLTPWNPPDDAVWWRIAAQLVPAGDVERVARAILAAGDAVWNRARTRMRSGTMAEIFAAAGLPDPEAAYRLLEVELTPHTHTDPQAGPLLRALRDRRVRVGVLSNTTWTRAHHERIFARDGVLDLLDSAVYTSEIPWTKPHPAAFQAAMAAVGVADPARCVFVGDRLFDDIHGAGRLGMRTVLVPHSQIPPAQHGHTDGIPDATIQQLADLLTILDRWA